MKYLFLAVFLGSAIFCSVVYGIEPVLMKIESIRGSIKNNAIVILLEEVNGERVLPLSIGGNQALAIHLGEKKIKTPRPMTHDLLVDILQSLTIKVKRVVISDVKDGVYYSEIIVRQGKQIRSIDARPSDAIAISLRMNTPIYAQPYLLNKLAAKQSTKAYTVIPELRIEVQTLTPTLAIFFGQKHGVLVSEIKLHGKAQKI